MSAHVFELPSLPHAFFDLADLFLINKEEARCLVELRNLGSEREVVDVLQCIVELCSLVSAVLEMPEIIVCVLWALSLIVVRDCIQGPPILIAVSWDNAYNVGVRAHDDPSVTRRDTSPFAVGNDTGDKIDPLIEVES